MPINHHIYVFTGSLQLFHVFYSNVLNIWNVLITVVERETSKSKGRKGKERKEKESCGKVFCTAARWG